jgi:hypothetical protein
VEAGAASAETEADGGAAPAGGSEEVGDAPPVQSSEPLDGLALVGSVLWDRAKRNPAPFAFIAGLLVALLAFKRARRRSA